MKRINVPELELKILKIMWDLNIPVSVQEVIDNWRSVPLPGYTTILKKLQVMEKKQLVDHQKNGRSYSYFPLIRKSEVTQSKFNTLLDDLFGGNKLEMAAAFVKDTGLSIEELDELVQKLDNEDSNE